MTKKHAPLTADQKLQNEMERERQATVLKSYLDRTGHGVPKTRREFLASGLVTTSGLLFAPSIYELITHELSAQAQVAGCPTVDPGNQLIPFININLAGGWLGPGQMVVHDANREPLQSYTTIGLGLPANFNIVREFGNFPIPSRGGVMVSKFMEALIQTAGPGAVANTAVVGVCHQGGDDTSSNRQSITGCVNAAGLKGSDLPNLGTRVNSITGVGMQPSFVYPAAPLRVTSFNDIQGALVTGGILAQQLAQPSTRTSLLNTVKSLSQSQKQRLMASSSGATLGKLVECATDKNVSLASSPINGVDPRTVPDIAAAWGIAPGQNNGTVTQAAIAYNALNGKSGACGIELGGYDYHGNARAVTDERDRTAGVLVGRILRTAQILGRPAFLHITTDGGVNTTQSETPDGDPSGDSGSRSMTYMIAYNPTARPATTDFQLGHYTNAQSADNNFITNWNAERASLAVFANYLKLNNKLGMLSQIEGDQFDAATLNRLIKFA